MANDRLAHNTKIFQSSVAVAAGSADSNGSSVNMAGFQGVTFIASLGTLTAGAVTALKAQQSSDDGSTDGWSDIEGSAVDVADSEDNTLVYLDIVRPTKQYVRPVVERATANAVINAVIALQYGADVQPVTHDATTVPNGTVIDDPAEGTA